MTPNIVLSDFDLQGTVIRRLTASIPGYRISAPVLAAVGFVTACDAKASEEADSGPRRFADTSHLQRTRANQRALIGTLPWFDRACTTRGSKWLINLEA